MQGCRAGVTVVKVGSVRIRPWHRRLPGGESGSVGVQLIAVWPYSQPRGHHCTTHCSPTLSIAQLSDLTVTSQFNPLQ